MSEELSKARIGALQVRGETKWNALQSPPSSSGKFLQSNGESDPSWETGSPASVWTSGTSAPSGGVDGDCYYKTDTYHVYQKIGGSWTDLGSIQGPTGTNGVGVPTGGTANQVLSKIDGSDYNTQWSSALSVTSVTATTYSNIIGSSNSSFGEAALQNNTTGLQNSAFGVDALHFNTTGN